jgi:hypothetical protein
MSSTSAAASLMVPEAPAGAPLPLAGNVLAVTARPGQESADLGGLLYAFRRTGASLALLCLTRGEASPLNSVPRGLRPSGRGSCSWRPASWASPGSPWPVTPTADSAGIRRQNSPTGYGARSTSTRRTCCWSSTRRRATRTMPP